MMNSSRAARMARPSRRWLLAMPAIALLASPGAAQTLDDVLDEQRFLDGLSNLRLPDLLEHYMQEHPPADSVEAAMYDLAGVRIDLADPSKTASQRLDHARRLIEIRKTMIDENLDDPRRAIWLADQATDLLFVVLPIEGCGMTNLFGLPSADIRRRGQEIAAAVHQLASEAELDIEAALMDLETAPGFADDIALQLQRNRLARDERDRRIPFLRGVGAFLHAEWDITENAARRDLYELTVETLDAAVIELDGFLLPYAQMRLALALTRLGEVERAEELFDAVSDDESSRADDQFGATMARASIGGGADSTLDNVLDALEQTNTAPDRVFYRMLIVDQRFLARRRAALASSGPDRDARLARAFNTYVDLIEADWGLPRETMRAIIFERLTTAATADVPLEQLPPLATVARAEYLARDAATRGEAIDLLERALKRTDLDDSDRVAALFGLGRARLAENELLDAGVLFLQIARDHPAEPGADRAMTLAATVAAELHRKAPDHAPARELLRSSISILLDRYPNLPEIDRWRHTGGELALREMQYADAIGLFDQVASTSPQYLDARFRRAESLSAWAKSAPDFDTRRERAAQLLTDLEVLHAQLQDATVSDAERADTRRRQLAKTTVLRASTQLDLEQYQPAVATLSGFELTPGLSSRTIADAVRIRIDAYYALGRHQEIPEELNRLVTVRPEQAGSVLGALIDARRMNIDALLDEGLAEDALEAAENELLPLAESLRDWIERTDNTSPALLLRAAAAFRYAERWSDGLQLYNDLAREHANALDVLEGRAECVWGLGGDRLGEAMSIYRRIAGVEKDGEHYWLAQLRMLQILDATARNTDRIAPRIRQLRLKDPDLGGNRFRLGFERLQSKYS